MTELQAEVMKKLYGENVWATFRPIPVSGEVQGWNGDHPSLARLASLGTNKLVVDVGVWKGQSTINMALAMKRNQLNGCVISIDTFLGSIEHWDMALFDRENGLPNLYKIFMSNVMAAGVQDYVVPLPQTSVTAASILRSKSISPAVVHIDAAHEYDEVIRDAREYYSLLNPEGYLIGDDYHSTWPGVIRAAGEFSATSGQPLIIETPKWIIQKPK